MGKDVLEIEKWLFATHRKAYLLHKHKHFGFVVLVFLEGIGDFNCFEILLVCGFKFKIGIPAGAWRSPASGDPLAPWRWSGRSPSAWSSACAAAPPPGRSHDSRGSAPYMDPSMAIGTLPPSPTYTISMVATATLLPSNKNPPDTPVPPCPCGAVTLVLVYAPQLLPPLSSTTTSFSGAAAAAATAEHTPDIYQRACASATVAVAAASLPVSRTSVSFEDIQKATPTAQASPLLPSMAARTALAAAAATFSVSVLPLPASLLAEEG